MMKEKLAALDGDARVKDSLDNGHMPTIHVSLGQLAASRPASQPLERVSGD
jgi:hypothetical protein